MKKFALFTQSEDYALEFSISISNPEILISRTNNINAKLYLNYDDAYSGLYPTKNLKPLDNNILKEMSLTEALIMRMMDRITIKENYYHRQSIYRNHLRYWFNVLENIDFVVFHVIPHEVFDYIAYSCAKLKRIKTFFYYSMPSLPYQYLMYIAEDINDQSKRITEIFNNIDYQKDNKFEENKNLLQIYNGLVEAPIEKRISYTGVEKNKKNISYFTLVKKIIKLIAYEISQLFGDNRSYGLIFNGKIRSTCFSYEDIRSDFLYFPLHYQPEASSNPIGEFYEDQLLIIDLLISKIKEKNLNLKIVIKEHPRQLNGSRKKEFYKFFENNESNNNLIVIDHNVSSHILLSKASGVITISGTIAWEALHVGKPVLMFGSRIFDKAPGIINGRTNESIDYFLYNLKNMEVGVKSSKWSIFTKILNHFLIDGTNSRYYFDNGMSDEKVSANNAINGLIFYFEKYNIIYK